MSPAKCKYCGMNFEPRTSLQIFCSEKCSRLSYYPPKHKNTCVVCGEKFQTSHKSNKTCSVECKHEFYNSKKCIWCGKRFSSLSKKSYCSEECRNMSLRHRAEACEKKPVIYTCKWCGETFESTRKKVYCSNECKTESIRRQAANKFQNCEWCGNKVNSPTKRKYCSDECKKESINHKKSLKKLEQFIAIPEINERTEKMRLKFGGRNISTWLTSGFSNSLKLAILERDGNRCYICGKETNLHIHHIIPREHGGPHIPENLITLCSGCHRSIESGDVHNAVKKCVRRALKNI